MLERILKLEEVKDDSLFLWGSRQTGKSTLLKMLFPKAVVYDLLKSDVRMALQMRPALLREECELLDEGEFKRADVNKDNNVDVIDVVMMRKSIVDKDYKL